MDLHVLSSLVESDDKLYLCLHMGLYSKDNTLSGADWPTGNLAPICLYCVCLSLRLIHGRARRGGHYASSASKKETFSSLKVRGVEGLVLSASKVQPLPNGTVGMN